MITLTSSTFRNNLLDSSSPFQRGGALTALSEFRDPAVALLIQDCEFSSNSIVSRTSAFGGAIAAVGINSIAIGRSSFRDNAINYNNNGTDLLSSTFGGALYLQMDHDLRITGSEFSGNGINVFSSADADNLRSSAFGGAMAVRSTGRVTLAMISNVTWSGNFISVGCGTGSASLNELDGGGAIYTRELPSFTMGNSTLTLNQVSGCHASYGGAIMADLSETAANRWNITNSIFSLNNVTVAPNGVPLPGTEAAGGALYLRPPSTMRNVSLSLRGVEFTSNSANGIPPSHYTCDPNENNCARPRVSARGGALSSPSLDSLNSTFKNNTVTGSESLGGAVVISTPTTSSIRDTHFKANDVFAYGVSASRGGALYIQV